LLRVFFTSPRAEQIAGATDVSFALTVRQSLIISIIGITFARLGVEQEKNKVASFSTYNENQFPLYKQTAD
jgi:hypothetical protein